MITTFKTCNKCGESKSLADYHKMGRKPDGTQKYNGRCIPCRNEDKMVQYLADPEKDNARTRAYHASNKESISKNKREYYQANKDSILTRISEYSKSHRIQRNQAEAKRCAIKLDAFVEDVDPQVLVERDGTACYLCGTELMFHIDNAVHIEHKTPLSRMGKHSYENTALACVTCNLSKSDKTEAEYRAWLQAAVA